MEEKQIDIPETYVRVSESKLKNALKEYRNGLAPFNGSLTALSFSIAMFTTWATASSDSSSQIVLKWVFFGLGSALFVVFATLFIVGLLRKRSGKGTEEWFMDEVEGKGHYSSGHYNRRLGSGQKAKIIDWSIYFFFAIGVPLASFLTAFGVNGWNSNWIVLNADGTGNWGMTVVVFLSIGTLAWLLIARSLVSFFALEIFDYDDGFNYPFD